MRDLQIDYLKNSCFTPVTNFALKCTGYVVESKSSKSVNSFLTEVKQKTDLAINPNQCEEPGEQFFLPFLLFVTREHARVHFAFVINRFIAFVSTFVLFLCAILKIYVAYFFYVSIYYIL